MSNAITIGFKTRTLDVTITRPNDTTAYTAGDTLSDSTSAPTSMKFSTGDGKPSGKISSAVAISSANLATKPDLELWLFDTDVAAASFLDNAAAAFSDAEVNSLVAKIAFPVASWVPGNMTANAGGNAVCTVTPGVRFNGIQGKDQLFGVVVVRNAYTPVALEAFKFRLQVELDVDGK